jgi:hypothetical protein
VCYFILDGMTSEVGVQLLDSSEELWWSHKGLYKSDAEYREDLTRYKHNLRMTGEELVVVEAEWSDNTILGTLGGPSDDSARNNTIDTINELFSWEANFGGSTRLGRRMNHSIRRVVQRGLGRSVRWLRENTAPLVRLEGC